MWVTGVQTCALPICLDPINWPPLIDIIDVSSESNSPLLGSPEYMVQSPLSPVAEESVEEENVVEPRVSERNKTMANVNMMEKADVYSRKRNLEGTSIPPPDNNSFAALSDSDLMLRAKKMGLNIPDNDFTAINLVRELEVARENLGDKIESSKQKENTLFIENNVGESTPLSMNWMEQDEVEEASFSVVERRKKGKDVGKSPVVVTIPVTRSKSRKNVDGCTQPPGRATRERRKPARFK